MTIWLFSSNSNPSKVSQGWNSGVTKGVYAKVTSHDSQNLDKKTKASILEGGSLKPKPERTVAKVDPFRDENWEMNPKSKTEQNSIEAPAIPEQMNRW